MRTDLRGPRRAVWALIAATGLIVALLAGAALSQGGSGGDGGEGAEQAITVTARRAQIAVGGDVATLQEGFTRITLQAAAGGPPQAIFVARLRPGVTVEDIRRFDRRNPNAVPENLVTLVTSNFVEPGGTFRTTVRLSAGSYIAAAEPQAPRASLLLSEFTVADTAAGGGAPAADARILMFDHGFRAPARISSRGTLRIENIGQNLHFIVGIRLNRPSDARRVTAVLRGDAPEPQGPPPGEFVSLLGLVSPGTENYVETRLRPGRYVIACFFGDRHSAGQEHSELGMVRTFTVTR